MFQGAFTNAGGGGAGSGSGDVVGPASSTDNAFARFDATTGKLLQNSGVTCDDSGNVTTAGSFVAGDTGFVFTSNGSITKSGNELNVSNGSRNVRIANTSVYAFETTETIELGLSSRRWENVWTKDVDLSGSAIYNEMGAAPTGEANKAKIFAQDNGAGKTQLMVVFGDDTPQELAVEP